MYHSITIDGINTWDDLHLIPTSRPLVNPPSVSMNQVAIPGMDGFIDLTEILSGRVNYGARQGCWEFIAHPDWTDAEPWHYKYSRIMQLFHGKAVSQVILEDDPFYYYTGRVSVNQWRSGESWSTVTLDYVLQPYKHELLSSSEQWKWDPFSFVNGIIRQYGSIDVNGTEETPTTLTIRMGTEPIVPKFRLTTLSSESVTITSDRTTETIVLDGIDEGDAPEPVYTWDDKFKLLEGDNILSMVGVGTLYIDFRGGWL